MQPQVRYSVACRAMVDATGKVLQRGHGGRYSTTPGGSCPHCHRPMHVTGAMVVQQVRR